MPQRPIPIVPGVRSLTPPSCCTRWRRAASWSRITAIPAARCAAIRLAFQREDLTRRRIVSCAESKSLRDRHWCEVAGLVLVRQRPGSAKGAMFITLEDETDIANLVV